MEFKESNAFFQLHKIELMHNSSIWTPQFSLAYKDKQMIEEMAQEQWKVGVIEPTSNTKYNSLTMVSKKESNFATIFEKTKPKKRNSNTFKEWKGRVWSKENPIRDLIRKKNVKNT